MTVPLPPDHPLRRELNDEVHARPPQPLEPPCALSYVALKLDHPPRPNDIDPLVELAALHGARMASGAVKHAKVDLGDMRVVWERHTEFMRYTFITEAKGEDPFAEPPIARVPQDWLERLPGQTMSAIHLAVRKSGRDPLNFAQISDAHFGGRPLIGAAITGGRGVAVTDLRIQDDGFTRFIIYDDELNPWQCGRLAQRLFEIETYRMLALLALPIAQKLGPFLNRCEEELTSVSNALTDVGPDEEPNLLERLTRLQAAIEHSQSTNQYRFSAANAYYALVRARIEDLREQRIEGLQTFDEFTKRRLAPAMNTCTGAKARQDALSERLDRATALLSTRVNMAVETKTQNVLESMNRRAKLQLRLQQTVEGLSVAAITYYLASLVGYGAKALKSLGVHVSPDLVLGISVPIIAGLAYWLLRRARKHLSGGE